MPTTATTNYNLPIYAGTDAVDLINGYNAAMQLIDSALKALSDAIDDINEDGWVTANRIATGAVGSTKLADSAVTTAKISANAVTSAKIANGAVNTSQLADDAVTSAKIADGAVGTSELASAAVTTAKIGASQITSALIADGTIVTADIANGAVTEEKLGANTLDNIFAPSASDNILNVTELANAKLTSNGIVYYQAANNG